MGTLSVFSRAPALDMPLPIAIRKSNCRVTVTVIYCLRAVNFCLLAFLLTFQVSRHPPILVLCGGIQNDNQNELLAHKNRK